jgi:hypothetical protein
MIKNLTPHVITIIKASGEVIDIPSHGTIRLSEVTTAVTEYEGVQLVRKSYGSAELPPQNGDIYIVSALVRQAFPHRKDLVSPGDLIRDENGNVIGCRNLICN